jgi:acetyltransferase-like isoleucine patch superfamily enzyme
MANTVRLRDGAQFLKDRAAILANAYHRRQGSGFNGRDLVVMRKLQRAGRLTMGAGTYGVPEVFTHMLDTTSLHIGNYSSIGCTFMLGGGHPPDRVTTYPHRIWMGMEGAGEDGFPAPSADTVVGSDVYAGWRSVLLSGVTVGDGAILAAGCLVTKDVPPFAIVGGNPAKLIRYRFTEEQREALLDIRWWDWPEDEVRAAVPLLAGEDIDAFISYARTRSPGIEAPAHRAVAL